MDQLGRPGQVPGHEVPGNAASSKLGEGEPQSLSVRKRSASDAEVRDGMGALRNQEESPEHTASPALKRPKVDAPPTAVGHELDEVEMPSRPQSQQTERSDIGPSPRSHSGWNSGVSSGLRTSFTALSKDILPKLSLQRASESALQSPHDPEAPDVNSLAMPPADSSLSRPRRESTLQAKFVNWCVQLVALNNGREALRDPVLLKDAWRRWLETRVSPSRAAQAAAMHAATETSLDSEKLEEIFSKAGASELERPTHNSATKVEHPESPLSELEPRNGARQESEKPSSRGSQEASEWTLPPPLSPSYFEVRQKDHRGWEDKFVLWCKALIQLNENKISADTPRDRKRVTESYQKWIGTVDGLSRAKSSSAKKAAFRYAYDNSQQLAALFADTTTLDEPLVWGPAVSGQEHVPPSPSRVCSDGVVPASVGPPVEDAEYRETYFAGIGPDETFCHMCASHGHPSSECPEMACRFCQDPTHRSFSCPTRLRCTKCKQLGHPKKDCVEKLSLASEEMECAFCGSHDHADTSCHELWRSFSFNPDTARRVRSLPVFCYCCGRQGHYGPVCGLNPQNQKEGSWETWSQANCDRYLDPASSEVAIAFSSSPASAHDNGGLAPERPDLGKSIVPKRHIIFEEADDEEEADGFIRPPVAKSARTGNITFSGNRARESGNVRQPGRQHSGSNGRQGYVPQPLPPKPPPPLPSSQRFQQDTRRNGGQRGRGRGRRDI